MVAATSDADVWSVFYCLELLILEVMFVHDISSFHAWHHFTYAVETHFLLHNMHTSLLHSMQKTVPQTVSDNYMTTYTNALGLCNSTINSVHQYRLSFILCIQITTPKLSNMFINSNLQLSQNEMRYKGNKWINILHLVS